jgi:uncharacterized protein (DUF924 family)
MRNSKEDIIKFWFDETTPAQWFQKSPEFDGLVKQRFQSAYTMALEGLCDQWQQDAEGSLALCLVLDQFPRNMFRDTAEAFASDAMALEIANKAIKKGFDQLLVPSKRRFLYLPFEHSENIEDQHRCVAFFEKMKDDDPLGYDYALRHLKVIEEFGRFPHRNAILGRKSTPDEKEYLAKPDAGF